MLILTVVHEFAPYKKGEQITDAAQIAAVLASENAPKVVKVSIPDPLI